VDVVFSRHWLVIFFFDKFCRFFNKSLGIFFGIFEILVQYQLDLMFCLHLSPPFQLREFGKKTMTMFVVTFWPHKSSTILKNCESCLWCFVWCYLILSTSFIVTLARNWGIFACLWDFNAISTRFIFLPYICTQLFDIPNLKVKNLASIASDFSMPS
jgi:hypothetical protein